VSADRVYGIESRRDVARAVRRIFDEARHPLTPPAEAIVVPDWPGAVRPFARIVRSTARTHT
jgi:hypothetical protein